MGIISSYIKMTTVNEKTLAGLGKHKYFRLLIGLCASSWKAVLRLSQIEDREFKYVIERTGTMDGLFETTASIIEALERQSSALLSHQHCDKSTPEEGSLLEAVSSLMKLAIYESMRSYGEENSYELAAFSATRAMYRLREIAMSAVPFPDSVRKHVQYLCEIDKERFYFQVYLNVIIVCHALLEYLCEGTLKEPFNPPPVDGIPFRECTRGGAVFSCTTLRGA